MGVFQGTGARRMCTVVAKRGGFLRALHAEGRTCYRSAYLEEHCGHPEVASASGERKMRALCPWDRLMGFGNLFWPNQEVLHFQS